MKCNVCHFDGNPKDAKFCIECASLLSYTGVTSRLSEDIPWGTNNFITIVSGAYQDLYPYKYIIISMSGQYNIE